MTSIQTPREEVLGKTVDKYDPQETEGCREGSTKAEAKEK